MNVLLLVRLFPGFQQSLYLSLVGVDGLLQTLLRTSYSRDANFHQVQLDEQKVAQLVVRWNRQCTSE